MIEDATFLVFADDWGRHPSSAQHLLRRFLERNRVLWFNTVGMRLPRFSRTDLAKIGRKLKNLVVAGKQPAVEAGPIVRELNLAPLPLGRAARKLNAWLLRRAISKEVNGTTYLITTLPLTADLLGAVPGVRFIYYMVDDYASWPGLGGRQIHDMDCKQAAGADLIVAASRALAELHANRARKPIAYLPHGLDVTHFGLARGERSNRQAHGDGLRADVIFFGALDERIDQDVLTEVARLRPELRFLIVGPGPTHTGALPNVTRFGAVPYAELPALLGRCRCTLLPYAQGPLGERLSPLKAREALAAGLPVVATDIPELRGLPKGVVLGKTAAELAAGIDRALAGEVELPSLDEMAKDSWENRAAEFASLLRGS